jgi:hypothetical protein
MCRAKRISPRFQQPGFPVKDENPSPRHFWIRRYCLERCDVIFGPKIRGDYRCVAWLRDATAAVKQ